MEEVWKSAVSTNFPILVSDLEISNLGRLRSVKNINNSIHYRVLKTHFKCNTKYDCIKRGGKRIMIHHLVAETFIGKRPENLVIDHIDGDCTNNRVSNLRYTDNITNSIKGNSGLNDLPQNSSIEDKLQKLNKKVNLLERVLSNLILQVQNQ
jgi:hypothetical protein